MDRYNKNDKKGNNFHQYIKWKYKEGNREESKEKTRKIMAFWKLPLFSFIYQNRCYKKIRRVPMSVRDKLVKVASIIIDHNLCTGGGQKDFLKVHHVCFKIFDPFFFYFTNFFFLFYKNFTFHLHLTHFNNTTPTYSLHMTEICIRTLASEL